MCLLDHYVCINLFPDNLCVAYKFLHLTVVFFSGREAPLVLQADIRRSVEERIHLLHTVQTGQGLGKAKEGLALPSKDSVIRTHRREGNRGNVVKRCPQRTGVRPHHVSPSVCV